MRREPGNMKRTRSKEEFIYLVSQNENIIHKICNLYAVTEVEKEDLKQEIIFQLWKSFPTFRKEAKFQTWMYKVALNTALVGLRRKKPSETEITEQHLAIHDDHNPGETEDKIMQLYKAIHQLNQVEKAVIFLYLERCTYKNIGRILGLSEKYISVIIVRCKEKLRKILENHK